MRQIHALLPLVVISLLVPLAIRAQTNTNAITRPMVLDAEKLIGLDFSESKIDLMLTGLKSQLEDFEAIHKFPLSNSVWPAVLFNPIPVGMKLDQKRQKPRFTSPGRVKLPANLDDLAFY